MKKKLHVCVCIYSAANICWKTNVYIFDYFRYDGTYKTRHDNIYIHPSIYPSIYTSDQIHPSIRKYASIQSPIHLPARLFNNSSTQTPVHPPIHLSNPPFIHPHTSNQATNHTKPKHSSIYIVTNEKNDRSISFGTHSPGSVFTNHSQEHSLSFSARLECNTTFDWLNRVVEPMGSFVLHSSASKNRKIWRIRQLLVVLVFNITLTAEVISWRSVTHMRFLAFSLQY